tara:strand:+ start:3034 stop:3447 length:414 start_codon:yes stop_codon:yes gene_type:complete
MGLEDFYRSLFGKDDELKKMEDEIEMWKDTPRYKVGMFFKLVTNGSKLRRQIINMFEDDKRVNVEDAGEFIMYNRAWFWLQDFNIDDNEWVEALSYYDNNQLSQSLTQSIQYFEEMEEYEKCSKLSSIVSILKKLGS